jgi:hypothetical protein
MWGLLGKMKKINGFWFALGAFNQESRFPIFLSQNGFFWHSSQRLTR